MPKKFEQPPAPEEPEKDIQEKIERLKKIARIRDELRKDNPLMTVEEARAELDRREERDKKAKELIEHLKLEDTPARKYFEGEPKPIEAELREEFPGSEEVPQFDLEKELHGEGGKKLQRDLDQLLEDLIDDPTDEGILKRTQARVNRQSLWESDNLGSEGRAELLMDQVGAAKELLEKAKSKDEKEPIPFGEQSNLYPWIKAAEAVATYRRASNFKGESFWSPQDAEEMETALQKAISGAIRDKSATANEYRRVAPYADTLEVLKGEDGLEDKERDTIVEVLTGDARRALDRYEYLAKDEENPNIVVPGDSVILKDVNSIARLKRMEQNLIAREV